MQQSKTRISVFEIENVVKMNFFANIPKANIGRVKATYFNIFKTMNLILSVFLKQITKNKSLENSEATVAIAAPKES